jgi:hypothetical protein
LTAKAHPTIVTRHPLVVPDEEVPLAGGMGSDGLVVRVGDTVRRPVRPHSATVAAFLRHLEAVGFTGAPRWLGHDEQGREVLSYVPGDVGVPPFPAWVADDELLRSVAELQAQLHAAARTFVPPADAVWDAANLPSAEPGAVVCHNDLCIENVVVREGRAVAFIDFDFAAPTDPRYDIAIAARHWVPVRDPVDLDPAHARVGVGVGVEQLRRFAAFADAHGLDEDDRAAVVAMLGAFLDRALTTMKARADAGRPGYVDAWVRGYPKQNRRARAWLDAHADELRRSRRG